jgi:hypothetical protein
MPEMRNPKDFLAGLLFMAFALVALVVGSSYPVGTASRMGPGYFPRALGIAILILGAVLGLRGFRGASAELPGWHWRPFILVLLSALVFGLTALWLGLVVASLALVLLSSGASPEFRWKAALISGGLQALAMAVIFVYGLGIPLPVWPIFLGGGR